MNQEIIETPDDQADVSVEGTLPAEIEKPPVDLAHVKRVLEAALLAATEPLTVQQLKRLFRGEVDADNLRKVLDELKGEWVERSIELTAVATGWRFRVKPEYQEFIDRISNEKPPVSKKSSGRSLVQATPATPGTAFTSAST